MRMMRHRIAIPYQRLYDHGSHCFQYTPTELGVRFLTRRFGLDRVKSGRVETVKREEDWTVRMEAYFDSAAWTGRSK